MSTIESRLKGKGLVLPQAAAPVASYVPTRIEGNLLFISGQLSMEDGAVVKGCLGDNMDLEAGAAAAQLCGLMLFAQAKAVLAP